MNYKDKFKAQMKKAGINSLDDLKTDAEKKAFFKAVDKSHDAKNEAQTQDTNKIAKCQPVGARLVLSARAHARLQCLGPEKCKKRATHKSHCRID